MNGLRRKADAADGLILTEPADLVAAGMNGPFHGALTTPVGFGLNPRKYLFGLAGAAVKAGASLFQNSPVQALGRRPGGYILATPQGRVFCDTVLVATNGYSSEDMPDWLAARYMPTQSAVLVTRPLSDAEVAAQGWSSDQMTYDTRNLLHYFRLMPDRRFLFGMRGGLFPLPRPSGGYRRMCVMISNGCSRPGKTSLRLVTGRAWCALRAIGSFCRAGSGASGPVCRAGLSRQRCRHGQLCGPVAGRSGTGAPGAVGLPGTDAQTDDAVSLGTHAAGFVAAPICLAAIARFLGAVDTAGRIAHPKLKERHSRG